MLDLPGSSHVDLWHVNLDGGVGWEPECEKCLPADERIRAHRLRDERDRRRFIACRATLRRLIGACTHSDPSALRFTYGHHGRPELDYPRTAIRFNVSHSGGRAVIAMTTLVDVGVDIELGRAVPDAEAVAQIVFSAAERRQLEESSDKSAAFLRGWTRKEALLKALGSGFGAAADRASVSLAERPSILEVIEPKGVPEDWSLIDLSDGEAVIALAVRAPSVTVGVLTA
jgi:4'-phosphopantetheinyl transferase